MNNTCLVTVSDDRFGRKNSLYSSTQNKVANIFKRNGDFGINRFKILKWQDIIKTCFYKNNKLILDDPNPDINGRCYKPFAISESLKMIDFGEFIIYNDVSPEIWSFFDCNYSVNKNYSLDKIKKLCIENNGILTSHVYWDNNDRVDDIGFHIHENFTLNKCMKTMDLEQYKNSLQHASGMIVLQKSKKSIEFVEEWLYWNLFKECASIYPWWTEESLIGKIGHRHDQSISGLLINKINNKLIKPVENSNIHVYNFLEFCRKDYNYSFVESNQSEKNNFHKMIHENGKWIVKSFLRTN